MRNDREVNSRALVRPWRASTGVIKLQIYVTNYRAREVVGFGARPGYENNDPTPRLCTCDTRMGWWGGGGNVRVDYVQEMAAINKPVSHTRAEMKRMTEEAPFSGPHIISHAEWHVTNLARGQ